MTEILEASASILREHGYAVLVDHEGRPPYLLFESDEYIGLLLTYDTPDSLLSHWDNQSRALLDAQKLGLRRSQEKAWNSYLVLLSAARASRLQQALLDTVEENLVRTRKIARSGMASREEIQRAILPLIPLQSPPNLQPVNMNDEIRLRASQIPPAILDAFFAGRDTSILLQLLEES